MAGRVLILGGGLAGLSVAVVLAERGFSVELHEAKPRLGGRAGSFQDTTTGNLVDVCQHVSMGCCTNLAHFCQSVGIAHFLQPQQNLWFMTADGRTSVFRSDPLPAPLHLARSFAGLHFLTLAEKARLAWGLACLRATSETADPPFLPWLLRHGQTRRTIDRFWGLVLVSALNESPERIGRRYARKVFVDGFMKHRRGFEVELPVVPLGRLYGEEMTRRLDGLGVRIVLGSAAREFVMNADRIAGVRMRDGSLVEADWYVTAVPFDRLLALLPETVVEREPCFRNLRELQTSPITSVHVWYDRPVCALPHVVLVDCVGQWVFNRGETPGGDHYLQVVVSASRDLKALGREEIETAVTEELSRLFPAARKDAIRRVKAITEHQATFSVVPGVDRLRPTQTTPIPNLFLAGDWTATGWPATMESAVRSGYLAAEGILIGAGSADRLVQPDLR